MVGEERSADVDPRDLGSLLGTTASHWGCLQCSASVEEGSTVALKSWVQKYFLVKFHDVYLQLSNVSEKCIYIYIYIFLSVSTFYLTIYKICEYIYL